MISNEFITFLGTKNLELISNFYQSGLGLTLYKDQGVCLIFNINSQSKIGICEYMDVIHNNISPILTCIIEKIDDAYEKPSNYGLEIVEQPKYNHEFKKIQLFLQRSKWIHH